MGFSLHFRRCALSGFLLSPVERAHRSPELSLPSISLRLLWQSPWCVLQTWELPWPFPHSFTPKSVTHLRSVSLMSLSSVSLPPSQFRSSLPFPGSLQSRLSSLPAPEPCSSTLLPKYSFQNVNLMPAFSLKSFNVALLPAYTLFSD